MYICILGDGNFSDEISFIGNNTSWCVAKTQIATLSLPTHLHLDLQSGRFGVYRTSVAHVTLVAVFNLHRVIQDHSVVVFSKTHCPYCSRAKAALTQAGIQYHVIELDVGQGIQFGVGVKQLLCHDY